MKLEKALPYARIGYSLRLEESIDIAIDQKSEILPYISKDQLFLKRMLSENWEVEGLIEFSELIGGDKFSLPDNVDDIYIKIRNKSVIVEQMNKFAAVEQSTGILKLDISSDLMVHKI